MKKLLYVIGGLAILFVAGLFLLMWYMLSRSEFEANRNKTAPARAARWPEKKEPDPSNEKEVNKFLDGINEQKNEEKN